MAKINNSNYQRSLEETLHVLGAVVKILMKGRVENRIEIGNIGAAIRNIQATLGSLAKKKQQAQRKEREERIYQQKEKRKQLEDPQSEGDANAETEV